MCTVQSELQCDVMCCTVLQHAGVARNDICGVVYRGVFARIVFAVLYVELCVLHRVSCSILSSMGWLRLVGSLKIYVSFAKEPYKRDHILLF